MTIEYLYESEEIRERYRTKKEQREEIMKSNLIIKIIEFVGLFLVLYVSIEVFF